MAGLGKLKEKLRMPPAQGALIWPALAAILAIGLLVTLVHLWQLPEQERLRAMAEGQRFTINPATGQITLEDGKAPDAAEAGFDVATEPAPEADPHEETDTAEPIEPEKTPEAAAPEHEASTEEPATTAATTPETPSTSEKPDVATAEESASAAPSETAAAETPVTAEAALPADAPVLRTEPITATLTAPTRTKDSLVMAPAPEVTEEVDGMKLPKRGEKDVTPAKLYAHPFVRMPDQVLISFVVMDAGLDPQSIGLIMGLPSEVSVAYSPYGGKANSYSENLRAGGHELWTVLPTMTDSYPADDPGPMGLVNRMPAEEIQRRTRLIMAAVAGSVGFVLPPNETITLQKESLSPTLNEMAARGLLMLASQPSRTLEQITSDEAIRKLLMRADLVLDPEPDEAQIKSKLAGLLAAAEEKGEYIVVLSARPQTLQILSDWLREVKLEAPLALAPLSALYQPREKPEAAAPEGDGHGAPEKKKEKKKPAEKKQKPLPQDKYLKPAGDKKEGGGHGGGGH